MGSTPFLFNLPLAEPDGAPFITIPHSLPREPTPASQGHLSWTMVGGPAIYDPVNLTELTALTAEIHNVAKIPIVYYDIPSATCVKLSPKELASLSKVGVKYLKKTSSDGPALTDMLFGLSDKITAFNGWDTLTFYGLAASAPGGGLKKGRELRAKIRPICKFLESHNYAAAVKTGLELTGLATGGLRKPFHMLGLQVADEMKVLIQNAGLKIV
ncbi:hypothetical protein BJX68DRAFT_258820 [Aspergillus pseudodeflectus]|uniref:Dihydrodipicolinate synthase n=1 Tax=Aspergillus pseudodeflectus TaxID=176178 RepID=A0ABR4JHM0_9EURO